MIKILRSEVGNSGKKVVECGYTLPTFYNLKIATTMGIVRNTKTIPIPSNAVITGKNVEWRSKRGKTLHGRLTRSGKKILIELDTWQIQYRDENGKLHRENPKIRNKETARFYLTRKIAEVEKIKAGILNRTDLDKASQKREPIAPLIEKYANKLLAEYISEKHVRNSVKFLADFCAEHNITSILGITSETVEKWIIGQRTVKKLAAGTINNLVGTLKAFCNWAVRSEYIDKSPLRFVKRLNSEIDRKKRRRAFTEEELRRLYTVAGKRELIYRTLAGTGLRSKELSQATPAQFDFENCRFRVEAAKTKNKKADVLPINPELLRRLKDFIGKNNISLSQPIFGYNPDVLLAALKRDLKCAGIEIISPDGQSLDVHAFRKTFGTMLARAGVPLTTTQRLMRHSSPILTAKIYIDVAPIDLQNAVSLLPDV